MKFIKIDDQIMDLMDPMLTIEPLWLSVGANEPKTNYEIELEPFNNHQRSVFAIMWLISEVMNGGFYQFYTNPTGIVWEDALKGFELLGISRAHEIVKESTQRFETNPSFTQSEREDFLDLHEEIEFDDLDTLFYQLDEEINLAHTIAEYIDQNRVHFYFEGEVTT